MTPTIVRITNTKKLRHLEGNVMPRCLHDDSCWYQPDNRSQHAFIIIIIMVFLDKDEFKTFELLNI